MGGYEVEVITPPASLAPASQPQQLPHEHTRLLTQHSCWSVAHSGPAWRNAQHHLPHQLPEGCRVGEQEGDRTQRSQRRTKGRTLERGGNSTRQQVRSHRQLSVSVPAALALPKPKWSGQS